MNHAVNSSFKATLLGILSIGLMLAVSAPKPQASTPEAQSEVEGITLRISFADDKTKFLPGELIWLELEVSAETPSRFKYMKGNFGVPYEGNQPGAIEYARIEPGEPAPPGETNRPMRPFSPEHLYGPVLPERYRYRMLLNDWRQFNAPGQYSVRIESTRFSRVLSENQSLRFKLASQPLAFEIMPRDPAWEETQLKTAAAALVSLPDENISTPRPQRIINMAALAAPGAPPAAVPQGDSPMPRGVPAMPEPAASPPVPLENGVSSPLACKTLRFLPSEKAALYLLDHFEAEEPCHRDFQPGILQSAQRPFLLNEMEQRMQAPDQRISAAFIEMLANLAWFSDHPGNPRYGIMRRLNLRGEDPYLERVLEWYAAAVYGKHGPARLPGMAAAMQEVAQLMMIKDQAIPPAWLEPARQELIDNFAALPPELQNALLGRCWALLADPALAPVLRQIASQPTDPSRERGSAKAAALERLIRLDPGMARPLVIAAIKRPETRASDKMLGRLPDQYLPELDDFWRQCLGGALKESREIWRCHTQLLARYATTAMAPEVAAFVREARERKNLERDAAFPLFAFLLRTEPAVGKALLDEFLRGMASGQGYSINQIAYIYPAPELTPFAKEYLQSPSAVEVEEAAGYLSRYGGAEAEKLLWDRFRQLNLELKNQPGDPKDDAIRWGYQARARAVDGLLYAIENGQAWLTDQEKLKRLQTLCVTPHSCQMIAGSLRTWEEKKPFPIYYEKFGDGDDGYLLMNKMPSLSFAQLKEKIAQFPRGTRFVFKILMPEGVDGREARRRVTRLLQEKGMIQEESTRAGKK